MSIAADNIESSAVASDKDVITEAEFFLTNFYDNAFGIKVSFDDCPVDTSKIGDIIVKAFKDISDYKDFSQWVAAAKKVGEYMKKFEDIFDDCPNTKGALK